MTGAPTTPSARPRLPLPRPWRRAVLVVHVVSGGAWIGVDVLVAVLVVTGRFAADVETRSLAYRALATFTVVPMLGSGLLCLASGLLLGLATRWGLLRYWWVAVKLALNLVLCTLIVVLLYPGMAAVDRYGRDLLAGTGDPAVVSQLFFPPSVSLATLSFATALAVVKPWGRVRRAR